MQVTFPKTDVLCIYGVPERELSSELFEWLEENEGHYLIVLDEDERALHNPSIIHERVRFCYAPNEEALKKLSWEFIFLQFDYLDHPANGLKEVEKMEKVYAKMAFFQEGISLLASDYQERGMDLLKNFMTNAPLFSKALSGKELFGKFAGVPAIICGAGPSLEKELPFLRTLENKALIFAGGTAITALSQGGVTPNFAGIIDPHLPPDRHRYNLMAKVPLFYQNRAHPKLLQQWQGPLLSMPGSEHDTLDRLLGEGTFDGGWNVATFLTAIAYHLGCNPIILMGVDLAQTKEQTYAGNLERSEGGKLIPVKGDHLFTRSDWLFAAEWFSTFAKTHTDVTWINASEGGLKIIGFETAPLHFEKTFDLQSHILAAVNAIPKQILTFSTKELLSSFGRVGTLCNEIIQLLEKLFPKSPESSGDYALLQMDIQKEAAYEYFLEPVWNVWKYPLARLIPKEVPPAYGIGLNQWLFMKGICDEARKI